MNEEEEPFNVETPPPKVYPKSISSLKMYRTCSLQWRYVKFDKIQRAPAAWLPQGTAFHDADAFWERSGREAGWEDVKQEYFRVFDEELEKYKEEEPDLKKWLTVGRTKIENDITARRERGLEQLERYLVRAVTEGWKPWELPDGEPAVEVPFFVDFGFGPIRGYIDKIVEHPNGSISIRDAKTGNRELTSIQLGVYALAANHTFDLDITHGDWYYAKDDTYSKTLDLTMFTVDYIRGEFEAMERGIDNRVFLANVGNHCALCPAEGICVERNSV